MRNSSALWIKSPLAVFTANQQDAAAGVVVSGTEIIELVPRGQTPANPITGEFDAREHVLLPGLINVHHHFYQTLTRAYPAALNKPLFPWLQTLYPVWAQLTPEHIRVASELAMVELMMSGCTTVSDHHYLFTDAIGGAIDIQVEVSRKLGMRGHLTRGSMSLGVDEGGLPPQCTVQDEQTIIDDSQRLIRSYHDATAGAMMRIALAPCSPFSVTPALMRESARLARDSGVSLHTHLAETEDENNFCLARFGKRPLDYLEDLDWLGRDVWLAHGIHFDDDEITRLGRAGVGVCHCPSSNMILASGICRTLELERAGAAVGLGVDGSASNDGSNLIGELRQALLIGRLRYQADEMTHLDVLRFATQGSARCLNRDDIGELAVGKQADLALFRLDELRFSGAGDPLAALLLCGAQQADRVMIAGRWRVEDGLPVGVDLADLRVQHGKAARKIQSL